MILLQRESRSANDLLNAHVPDWILELMSVNGIAITNHVIVALCH